MEQAAPSISMQALNSGAASAQTIANWESRHLGGVPKFHRSIISGFVV